jgi:hypothetical protein
MRTSLTSLMTVGVAVFLMACGAPPPTGSGGAGATGGTGGTGGVGGSGGSSGRPACFAANQTIVVGDSYINWGSHSLPADLQRESGQTWPLFAVGGASIASGGIATLIPQQLEQAIAQYHTFSTLFFDGGGNDVLICDALKYPGCGDCKNNANAASVPVCQQVVQAALDAAAALVLRAAQVGVKDVVYFFYPTVPAGTPIGGAYPNVMNDYARPKAKALCATAQSVAGVRCTFVDMVPVFQGHPEYFAIADIHPNTLGSAAMAKAIWAAMKANCVSQPASSGCCG